MNGLVLEGGAMRGMFTAGVTDVMQENGLSFDGIIGVSAGAAFGCNYKSCQPGRAIRYNLKYCRDPRYCSLRSLVLGLLAWAIPAAAASDRLGRHVGGRFPVWSMACCGGALLSELLVVRGRCLRGDWPGVADTIGAVCLAGMVLLAVSAALNVLALALRALDKD